MNKLFFLSLPLLLWACDGDHAEHDHTDHDHGNDHADEEMTVHAYGAEFTPENAISFTELQKQMETNELYNCVLETEIVESCQKMGCWMSVATEGEPMMVYMNDHEFFVPKQGVSGLKSYIQGEAYYDTLSVDFQKHLLEDAERPQEEIDAITEPKFELAFNATGVIIEGYDDENEEMNEDEDHQHGDEYDHDHDDDDDDHNHDDDDHDDDDDDNDDDDNEIEIEEQVIIEE